MMNENTNGIPIAVVGCDFRLASSRWRSGIVLSDDEAVSISKQLRSMKAADGFFDLNTCNRNEWIVSGSDIRWAAELLRTQMKQRLDPVARNSFEPYIYTGKDAAMHIFRVATGQKSLVVGERQIASQLYKALEVARKRGTSSRVLNGLGTVAGRLVRIALRRGLIENAAVGVHSLALNYLRNSTEDMDRVRVAVVGMGRIGKRIQGLLEEDEQFIPVYVNRTVGEEGRSRIHPLSELVEVLSDVDAAIVATGAMTPVVRSEHIPVRTGDRGLLILDIGIPEQVERDGIAEHVQIAGLDELTEFYNCERSSDAESRNRETESLVDRAVDEFHAFCSENAVCGILDTVQKHHRQLVNEEIPRLIENRLAYVPEKDRERLRNDLRNIVFEYTNEVFNILKDAGRQGNGDE